MHQRVETDSRGRHVLKGELINESGDTVNIPHVLATYYDSAGKVIWVSDGYVDNALLPQTPVPFAVDLRDDLAANVHNYRVTVNEYMLSAGRVAHDQGLYRSEGQTRRHDGDCGVADVLLCDCHARGRDQCSGEHVTAGSGLSIPSSGSGSATLYVVGPGTAIKRTVQLGQDIQLSADELQNAGRLCGLARRKQRDILCDGWSGAIDCVSGTTIARAS